MGQTEKLKIVEEANVIDDHLLDIIGNDFRFDHEKGLAEWLKNSIDAYRRADIPDTQQHIILNFNSRTDNGILFECIDFVGMNKIDIEKAFKRWGDPEAARRGLNRRVFGGHGNGGKFYMRQMFHSSYFITFKNNHLSIFGFSENKKYGFAQNYRDKKITPEKALKIADIDAITFPENTRGLILSGKTGFTIVRGIKPSGIKSETKILKTIDRLKNQPQARRIIPHINVWVSFNGSHEYKLLRPNELTPLPGFENPVIIEIPSVLLLQDDGEKLSVEMTNEKYRAGRLILKTSEEAFGLGSRSADLNRIDIVGEVGVIGSYQLYKLGVNTFPQASFIYGECECPLLEDPQMDSVKNDRSELVENPRSKALLLWIRECVDNFANQIASKQLSEQVSENKKISVAFNEYLNRWKDQFMPRIIGDLFSRGDGDGGVGGGGHRGKIITIPENGLSFTFPAAEIDLNIEKQITLKAMIPLPIPMGARIKISSNNDFIEILEKEIVVRSQNIRTIQTGETIAIFNIPVIGRRINESGEVFAVAGKHIAKIKLHVTEDFAEGKNKKLKSPRVLLSGIDRDPLEIASSGLVVLTERDPVVYQRYQDVSEGIFWINTQSPIASAILDRCGDHSVRWRDYLFQRYVDIFVKQAIYELQKKDPENFRAERIDSDILDSLIRRIHSAALNDLTGFFFEEEFDPMSQQKL